MEVKNSNDISSENTHHPPTHTHTHTHTHTQKKQEKPCILLGAKMFTNVQRIIEISNLGFGGFFISLPLTWDHMGANVSNDISSERTHHICSPKFMYTRGEGLYQSY